METKVTFDFEAFAEHNEYCDSGTNSGVAGFHVLVANLAMFFFREKFGNVFDVLRLRIFCPALRP